jgi:hypothetical protein
MVTTIVPTFGEMTLYLEFYDSLTNELIGQVIDPEEAEEMGGFGMSANSVTNKAAADRILHSWADILAKYLGDAQPVHI